MKWSKHKVEIDKLDQFFNDYKKVILKGDANLEHFYYALTYKDNPIILHTSPALVFFLFSFLTFKLIPTIPNIPPSNKDVNVHIIDKIPSTKPAT